MEKGITALQRRYPRPHRLVDPTALLIACFLRPCRQKCWKVAMSSQTAAAPARAQKFADIGIELFVLEVFV